MVSKRDKAAVKAYFADEHPKLLTVCLRELGWFQNQTGEFEDGDVTRMIEFVNEAISRRVNDPKSRFWLTGKPRW